VTRAARGGAQLGFGFSSDARRLACLFPALALDRLRVHDCQPGAADGDAAPSGLHSCCLKVHSNTPGACAQRLARLPLHRAAPTPVKARVHAQLLGKGIDKRQQCSNWDRRPLLQAQVAAPLSAPPPHGYSRAASAARQASAAGGSARTVTCMLEALSKSKDPRR